MYQEHPLFEAPPEDAILWRYLTFTKFVSLLDRRAIFFPRADMLGDPFEGSRSNVNLAMRSTIYGDEVLQETFNRIATFSKAAPRFTLVSCWHESKHESAAMWRLYSGEEEGIAVRTDFESLKGSFTCDEWILIGRVSYADYETTFIAEDNTMAPFLVKRAAFEHEREVRAVHQNFPYVDGHIDVSGDGIDGGAYFDVDIDLLIKEVMVAPYAEDWFLELVQSVATRYNLKVPVRRSSLADSPTWA